MAKLCSLALVSFLAATVIAHSSPKPAIPKSVIPGPPVPKASLRRRQADSDGSVVYFRTDLKSGEGLSEQFKFRLLSRRQSPTVPERFDVSFVDLNQRDMAERGIIEAQGIPLLFPNDVASNSSLKTNSTQKGNSTSGSRLYLNVEADAVNPSNAQRVTLDTEQKGVGFLYTAGNELKLGSTNPGWDTWMACDPPRGNNGQEVDDYAILWWAAAVPTKNDKGEPILLVSIPQGCTAVRIFVDVAGTGAANNQLDQCQLLLQNAGYRIFNRDNPTTPINTDQPLSAIGQGNGTAEARI